MDYEFIGKLQKSLEDLFESKFNMIFNTKDYGDLRELQGFMKAIKVFGDIISESNNPTVKNKQEEHNADLV